MKAITSCYVLVSALGVGLSLADRAEAKGLQAAIARSRQTGLPLFVVGSSDS